MNHACAQYLSGGKDNVEKAIEKRKELGLRTLPLENYVSRMDSMCPIIDVLPSRTWREVPAQLTAVRNSMQN